MFGLLGIFGKSAPVTVTLLSEPEVGFPGEVNRVTPGKVSVHSSTRLSPGSLVKIENNAVIALGEVVFSGKHAQAPFADVLVKHVFRRPPEPRMEPDPSDPICD